MKTHLLASLVLSFFITNMGYAQSPSSEERGELFRFLTPGGAFVCFNHSTGYLARDIRWTDTLAPFGRSWEEQQRNEVQCNHAVGPLVLARHKMNIGVAHLTFTTWPDGSTRITHRGKGSDRMEDFFDPASKMTSSLYLESPESRGGDLRARFTLRGEFLQSVLYRYFNNEKLDVTFDLKLLSCNGRGRRMEMLSREELENLEWASVLKKYEKHPEVLDVKSCRYLARNTAFVGDIGSREFDLLPLEGFIVEISENGDLVLDTLTFLQGSLTDLQYRVFTGAGDSQRHGIAKQYWFKSLGSDSSLKKQMLEQARELEEGLREYNQFLVSSLNLSRFAYERKQMAEGLFANRIPHFKEAAQWIEENASALSAMDRADLFGTLHQLYRYTAYFELVALEGNLLKLPPGEE